MSRKRCKRTVWVMPLGMTPLEHAKHMASKLSVEEINKQMAEVQSVIDRLIRGDWDKYDCWSPLFECLSRIESMGKLNRIRDYKAFIDAAQVEIVNALNREKLTGATAFKAEEIKMVREIGAAYWTLLNEATHRQFSDACKRTTANSDRITRQKNPKTGKVQVDGVTA